MVGSNQDRLDVGDILMRKGSKKQMKETSRNLETELVVSEFAAAVRPYSRNRPY